MWLQREREKKREGKRGIVRTFERFESNYRARPFSESYASRTISVNKLGDDDVAGEISPRAELLCHLE